MNDQQRRRLLHVVCGLLPRDHAGEILALPPDDYMTYVKAYIATRDLALPRGLRQLLLTTIYELMDAETERTLRARESRLSP